MQGLGMDLLYQTVFKTAILLLRVCRRIPIAMRTIERFLRAQRYKKYKGTGQKLTFSRADKALRL